MRASCQVDSCPQQGQFDQEDWVMRQLAWESIGPETVNAFMQAADCVAEVQEAWRRDDQTKMNAGKGGRR